MILGSLKIKILLKEKYFLFFEKTNKIIALNQDDIEVAIGIIKNPTFENSETLIIILRKTDTKDI